MWKAEKTTTQIWHCDPLVVAGEDESIIYADRATVEFEPSPDEEVIGRAKVVNAHSGPPLEIEVLSRMERADRVPDLRFGIRSGFTLLGRDPAGEAVSWYVDGAADLFTTTRASEEASAVRHWRWVTIRDLERDEALFAGPADVARSAPNSVDDLALLRVVSSNARFTIEVRDTRRLWPTLSEPHFGEVHLGADAAGRSVEWTFRG